MSVADMRGDSLRGYTEVLLIIFVFTIHDYMFLLSQRPLYKKLRIQYASIPLNFSCVFFIEITILLY